MLTKIASTVRALIAFDAFSVFLVDRDQNLLRHRFSRRYDQRITMENFRLAKELWARPCIRASPCALPTCYPIRAISSLTDVRSEVAVPLVFRIA